MSCGLSAFAVGAVLADRMALLDVRAKKKTTSCFSGNCIRMLGEIDRCDEALTEF